MESVLNIECSKYASAKATDPVNVNLLEWLTDSKYLPLQEKVRSCKTKDEKDIAKRDMPCITPSGTFSKRGKDYLLRHTGLIAIDIDGKDNGHVSNFTDLKKELCKLSTVAYCGLSVSGTGYWLLIPIAFPDKHEKHFQFIEKYFAEKSLIIDPACKDVSRLRFYSYDPDAYFNHAAKPLQTIYAPVPPKPKQYKAKTFSGQDLPVWEQYSQTDHFIDVLKKYGWTIESKRGNKTYFTRPDKNSGISAEFDPAATWTDKAGQQQGPAPMFHVFSSNAHPFEGGRGYSPFQVYAILEHGSDFSKAAKSLRPSYQKSAAFRIATPVKVETKKTEIREFIKPENPVPAKRTIENGIEINEFGYPAMWDDPIPAKKEIPDPVHGEWTDQINELYLFFEQVKDKTRPVKLDSCTPIQNPEKMIQSHLKTVKLNNGNKTFLPFLNRLNTLKKYYENYTK